MTPRPVLAPQFTIIYLDRTLPSLAGPGVLLTFAGAGPFRKWLGDDVEIDLEEDGVPDALVREYKRRGPLVGVLGGFSQGARQ